MTVTTQETVTVTQIGQVATSAGAGDTSPVNLAGSPQASQSTGVGEGSSNAANADSQGGAQGSASLPGGSVEKVVEANVSKSHTRTKCNKAKASSTAITSASSDTASTGSNPSTYKSTGSGQSDSGSSPSNPASSNSNTGSSPSNPASGNAGSGSQSSASSSGTGQTGTEASSQNSNTSNSGSQPDTSSGGNVNSISESAAVRNQNSGSKTPDSGSSNSNVDTSNQNAGSSNSTSTSGASSSGPSALEAPYSTGNSTSGSPFPSQVSGLPLSSGTSTPMSLSNISSVPSSSLNGQFWAGATLGTLVRMEAIPERKFYDFDGATVKDPFKTLGDAGVNAVRVEGTRGQCLGPTTFVNNGSTLGEELTFTLDWGCLDVQVQTAQRGVAEGMRVVLTINQGFDIPAGMESYTYSQMVGEVQAEAKRQLQPFLDAKIVPDVILFENEGSDGFLFNETATGHARGNNDGKVSNEQLDKELCGEVPTGSMDSYPQYAGYLKAELAACNEIIKAAGYPTDGVRYGLHSHDQYVQWKESLVHGPNQLSDQVLKDSSGNVCNNSVIPSGLLAQNTSQLLTVMGFSAYPMPMTPADINSQASENATLDHLVATLTQLQGYAEAYGKEDSGPYAGQYKLQSLGVEYGTSYTYDQVPQEQDLTNLMWDSVKNFSNLLGILWYEPWYCHADWEGGKATLCHSIDSNGISGEAPTNTLTTWAKAAISPWKK